MDLKGKNIILGVTGSIAAYKIAGLASALKKRGADITVIMTENATNFINPITFETLTGNKCLVDTFDRNFQYSVEHVSLAKKADVFIVAPASCDVIAKAAHGIADDMLTTTLMACTCPKIFAPAMNTRMYENPINQDNMKTLEHYGMSVITPATGYLACGDTGAGKMPEPEILLEHIIYALTEKDLIGKKVMVTAGPTREVMDPVRYLSNFSTGKMGYAIARAAAYRGAKVTLISGPVALTTPLRVERIDVVSSSDMADAVFDLAKYQDIIIKAAAVADYRPKTISDNKIKKKDDDLTIDLERTTDILSKLGQEKKNSGLNNQFICGFSMETENMVENARGKLERKNIDMIVANNVKVDGAGFGTDTNVVTLIDRSSTTELPIMTKSDVADKLLSEIIKRI